MPKLEFKEVQPKVFYNIINNRLVKLTIEHNKSCWVVRGSSLEGDLTLNDLRELVTFMEGL